MYVGRHNSLWFEFGKSNIELSCAAASAQRFKEFKTEFIYPVSP